MVKKFIKFIAKNLAGPLFLVIDLFCGFGGTTTGYDNAVYAGPDGKIHKIAKVIACVNHDPKAIKSHWLNHPDVKHFEEDIRTLDLTELAELVAYWRAVYPNAYVVLWASLECTNFSKAKGGQARDADSRTLALHLFKYIVALNPDYVKIENVVEFMAWGPMKGKVAKTIDGFECCTIIEYKETEVPILAEDGTYLLERDGSCVFVNKIMPRFNGVPESKNNGKDWMRWRRTINKICFDDEWKKLNSADFGAYTSRPRLFGCFARIGLPIIWPEATHSKVIKKGHKNFYLQQQMYKAGLKPWKPVKEVLDFKDEGESIFNRKKALVPATLERIYKGLVKFGPEGDHFLTVYYSGGGIFSSVDNPCPVVPANDRFGLLQKIHFIDKHYGQITQIPITDTAGTIVTNDKHRLFTGVPFLMPTNFSNSPVSLWEPSPVITANGKYHYIVNPSHGGHCTSTENPCPVVIARQDKAPLYLVQAISGTFQIPIYEDDCSEMVKIKELMAKYGLCDIKMRMLKHVELLVIQGFPSSYKMVGTSKDRKKFIGNSVVPHVVKSWSEAFANRLISNKKTA